MWFVTEVCQVTFPLVPISPAPTMHPEMSFCLTHPLQEGVLAMQKVLYTPYQKL